MYNKNVKKPFEILRSEITFVMDLYTIVKGRETFCRRHTVPVTSCSEVKYVLKRVSFGSKDCTKELKLECAYFPGPD